MCDEVAAATTSLEVIRVNPVPHLTAGIDQFDAGSAGCRDRGFPVPAQPLEEPGSRGSSVASHGGDHPNRLFGAALSLCRQVSYGCCRCHTTMTQVS